MNQSAVSKLDAEREREKQVALLKELKTTDQTGYENMRAWFKTKYGYDYTFLEKQR